MPNYLAISLQRFYFLFSSSYQQRSFANYRRCWCMPFLCRSSITCAI